MAYKDRVTLRIGKASNTNDQKKQFNLDDICIGNRNFSNKIYYDLKSDADPYNAYVDLVNNDDKFTKDLTRRTRVPYIRVVEFEPDMVFKFAQHLEVISSTISTTLDAFSTALEPGNLEKLFKAVVNGGSSMLGLETPYSNENTEENVNATDDLVANLFNPKKGKYIDRVVTHPMERYRNFFRGEYINSYEIPYTDDVYMEANGTNGWSVIGKDDINLHNNFLNSVWKLVSNLGIVDTNPVPIWKRDASGDFEYYNISCEFYLNNKDLTTLAKNYYFLITLIGGPLWVQSGSRFFPPNIYTVEVPGVVNLLYSTMMVDVTSMGNRRKLPYYGDTGIDPDGDADLSLRKIYDDPKYQFLFDPGMDSEKNVYYPDAWKITVTFKSLVPNNFNNYLNYLLNGSLNVDTNTYNSGGTTNDLIDKFFKSNEKKESKK